MEQHLTLEEMQAELTHVEPSPRDRGRLEMIVCRPGVDQREVLEQGELNLQEGLAGDNWRARGSGSTPDGRANPDMHVTLMNSRIIQLVARDPQRWPLAGDQLFVDFDLSQDNLPAGQRIAIGEAVLEISRVPHTGCAKFTARFGSNATRFVNSPEGRQQRRRGVNARVIKPGAIRQGDIITKIPPESL